MKLDGANRCAWATTDPLYVRYHDVEWGVPQHDDRRHFEFLTLEGAQAGLSWITILRKREGYAKAFSGFDPAKVARFDAGKKERLMADAGIVRNRLKIESTVDNARAFLAVRSGTRLPSTPETSGRSSGATADRAYGPETRLRRGSGSEYPGDPTR